jgi:DNA-directed RNA polymerase alpha subunit
MGWIGERFGLTRARISQIFFKGCRKAKELEHLKATVDRAEKDQLELDYLRKKVKQDADRIKALEEKLNIKNNTQEEQERDLLMMRLVDYNFTVRTLNCLRAADIETVGDLVQVRRSALLKFRNFGRKSMKELDDFLEAIGKSWGTRDVHRGAHGEIYWTD